MKTLSSIKKDLEFNRGLSSLIEVLKNIAVSQYRTLEQRIKTFKEFLSTIESFFEFIDVTKINHPFLNSANNPQAVVAITSDTGMLGGLNMQVITTAISELQKIPGKLIVIGERGKIYAKEYNLPFVAFSGIKDEECYFQAMQLRDYLVESVLQGAFTYLKVVYPRPISFTFQQVETISFLPFLLGRGARTTSPPPIPEIIIESDPADIIEYLISLWMGQKLYELFGLSRLAEFAARFVHLEDSLQKLKEMDKKLIMQYFRLRHELIDQNMRELFSARSIYAR